MLRNIIVGIGLFFAVLVSLYLPYHSPHDIFNTPDENANYFFATHFGSKGALQIHDPIEKTVDNAVHPRGINVIAGFLVPESFVGLSLLHGIVARVVPMLQPYVVPCLTLLALFLLWKLYRRLFGQKMAFVAIALLSVLPPLIYWTGRPFMHTLLFLDLAILGWSIILWNAGAWDLVGGIIIGASLVVRTSEAVWVGLVTLLCILVRDQKIMRMCKVGIGCVLVLGPLLLMNKDIYGNFFGTGYSVTESNLVVEGGAIPQLARTTLAAQLLIPFGFHPIDALARFSKYALGAVWWYAVPMVLGCIIMIARKSRYAYIWTVLSMYLIISYGSFNAEQFADPTHPLGATIGSPYLRYWLPIFIFGAPMVAEFFMWVKNRCQVSGVRCQVLVVAGVMLVGVLSLRAVIWHGPESWRGIEGNLIQFKEMRERIERTTPENAVFITPRWADRIVFPKRSVIVDIEGKDPIAIIRTLKTQGHTVFWWRGRGEIKLEPEILNSGFTLNRRFDVDPKGKIYEIL